MNLTEKLEALACLRGEHFYALTPPTVPRRYHYAGTPRVGDVILESAIGHTLFR